MTDHWVCTTEECERYDHVFSSTKEMAICPNCERPLKPMDEDFDSQSQEGRELAELPDAYLARGLVAALVRDQEHDSRMFEAEIRRRHGIRTVPQDWAEAEMTSGKRVYGVPKSDGGKGTGISQR